MDKFEHLNNESFLAELQAGSVNSFDRLAQDLFPALRRYLVLRIGIMEADVEDIVQEALIKVYDNANRFRLDGEAKLTSWIFHIARNLAIDLHRASDRPQHTLDKSEFPSDSRVRFAGLNLTALRRLRNGLEMLPSEDQQILKWRACDVPFGEIAGWLSMKENTVRVRHLRAAQRLRDICERMERENTPEEWEGVLV